MLGAHAIQNNDSEHYGYIRYDEVEKEESDFQTLEEAREIDSMERVTTTAMQFHAWSHVFQKSCAHFADLPVHFFLLHFTDDKI